tara:strand:+ start:594 stop:890 length:297 start_codon:yes stop_codon:yes gene_type:complete
MSKKAVISSDGLTLVDLTTTEKNEITGKEKSWTDSKPDRQKQKLRFERESLLQEADYKINTLIDNNQDASAWRTYRQQLRDITKASDLDNVKFPSKPS